MASFLTELKGRVPLVESAPVNLQSQGPAYGDPEYWDERYLSDGPTGTIFEWLLDWHDLEPVMVPELRKWGAHEAQSRLLHPGCGNSSLGTDLRLAGFGRGGILNSDISPTVVDQMKKKFPECTYEVDDCVDMKVAKSWASGASKFDVVVDKGTLDALACTQGTAAEKGLVVSRYLREIEAVLKPTGALLVVSFGQPETRINYFHDSGWRVVGDPSPVRKRSHRSLGQVVGSRAEASSSEDDEGSDLGVVQTGSSQCYYFYVAVPNHKAT